MVKISLISSFIYITQCHNADRMYVCMYVHVNNVIYLSEMNMLVLCSRRNRNISASCYCHRRIFLLIFTCENEEEQERIEKP